MSPKTVQAHRWVICMHSVLGRRAALIDLIKIFALVTIFNITVFVFMRRPL